MAAAITDDVRALVALAGRPEFLQERLRLEQSAGILVLRRGRWRAASLPDRQLGIDQAIQNAGLIELDDTRSARDGFGHDLKYRLTETGGGVAAALDVTLDQAIAAPKPRPAKPELIREEREAAKKISYARKNLSFLARGGRLVKNDRGAWAFNGMDKPYVPPGRNSYDMTADRNLPLVRHLTEEFVGVDGRPSLRINAAGAEIIAKRRPLNQLGSNKPRSCHKTESCDSSGGK